MTCDAPGRQYAAWQPISTDLATLGTKAPYYGSVTVAAALGNLRASPATVVEIPLNSSTAALQPESAYAIYTNGKDCFLTAFPVPPFALSFPSPTSLPLNSLN